MPQLHPPTKSESTARAVGYCFTSVLGFYALLVPVESETAAERLGPAAVIWALFLLTSLPAAVATLFGRWRVEYILLPLFGSGLAVAIVSAWINVASGDLLRIPRTSVATALLCMFVVRVFTLHRVTKVAKTWIPTPTGLSKSS